MKNNLFLLSFVIGTLFSSCAVPHYMYSPTAVNVPSFTEKGESSAGAVLSNHGYDLQGGYSISNHFAVLGSWYWRHERQYNSDYQTTNIFWPAHDELDSIRYMRNFLTAEVMYFTPVNPRKTIYFDFSSGYSFGHFNMFENKRTHTYTRYPADTIFNHTINDYPAAMHRITLQPAIMFHSRSVNLTLSLRWSAIWYNYNEMTDSLNKFGVGNNSLYSFIEPALTLHITPRIKWLTIQIQTGMSGFVGEPDFYYHFLIGNLGMAIDPIKLLGTKIKKEKNEFFY